MEIVTKLLQKASEGLTFTFVTDRVTTKVGAQDTSGQYSLMTWVAAPKTGSPPHVHAHCDETFYVVQCGYNHARIGHGDQGRGIVHGHRADILRDC